jgi:hypothetical protein
MPTTIHAPKSVATSSSVDNARMALGRCSTVTARTWPRICPPLSRSFGRLCRALHPHSPGVRPTREPGSHRPLAGLSLVANLVPLTTASRRPLPPFPERVRGISHFSTDVEHKSLNARSIRGRGIRGKHAIQAARRAVLAGARTRSASSGRPTDHARREAGHAGDRGRLPAAGTVRGGANRPSKGKLKLASARHSQ